MFHLDKFTSFWSPLKSKTPLSNHFYDHILGQGAALSKKGLISVNELHRTVLGVAKPTSNRPTALLPFCCCLTKRRTTLCPFASRSWFQWDFNPASSTNPTAHQKFKHKARKESKNLQQNPPNKTYQLSLLPSSNYPFIIKKKNV